MQPYTRKERPTNIYAEGTCSIKLQGIHSIAFFLECPQTGSYFNRANFLNWPVVAGDCAISGVCPVLPVTTGGFAPSESDRSTRFLDVMCEPAMVHEPFRTTRNRRDTHGANKYATK
jgi:hypothetical protein